MATCVITGEAEHPFSLARRIDGARRQGVRHRARERTDRRITGDQISGLEGDARPVSPRRHLDDVGSKLQAALAGVTIDVLVHTAGSAASRQISELRDRATMFASRR